MPFVNAVALIAAFGEDVTITRFLPGAYVDGIWQEAQDAQFEATMSVQPVTDRELENLPEGRRSGSVNKCYIASDIFTIDARTQRNPDRVSWQGRTYELIEVQRWRGDLGHWKGFLAEIKEGRN